MNRRRMMPRDGRRGVKGTGRYGIGGSRYYPRRDRGAPYDYGDYERQDMRRRDYRMDGNGDMGHRGYEPVEFMGYCSGYYGSPEEDYGRNGRVGYGRDYNYDRGGYYDGGRMDYGYYDRGDDYGDYGETLSDEELEHWNKKLLHQLDERERQMFSKESVMQKIKQMNIPMSGFGEKELYTASLAMYTDHKASIGQNLDLAIKLGRDFLVDKDSNVKGAERLAVYYDTFVDD